MRRRLTFIAAAVLLILLALWRIPAGTALGAARSLGATIEVEATQGTVWAGRANGVRVDGVYLGDIEWALDRLETHPDLATRWSFHGSGPQSRLDGLATVDAGGRLVRLASVSGWFPAAWLDIGRQFPLLYLDGQLELDLDSLELTEGLPAGGNGRILWSGAGIDGAVRESLGSLELDYRTSDQGDGLVFGFRSLEQADLRAAGQGTTGAGRYEISLELRAHPHRRDLAEFLRPLGDAAGPGRYRFRWEGALPR